MRSEPWGVEGSSDAVVRYPGPGPGSYRPGRLVGVTTPVGFAELDPVELGLVELECAERHGLIWVARTPATSLDLDQWLPGELNADLEAIELGEFAFERNLELAPEVNWKLIIDGFLENYHVRFLHATTLNASCGSRTCG